MLINRINVSTIVFTCFYRVSKSAKPRAHFHGTQVGFGRKMANGGIEHNFFRRLKHFGKIMFLLISMSESCGQNHTPSFQLSSGWCLNLSTAFLYSKKTTMGTTLGSLKSLEHTCVQQWRHPNLIQLAMLGRITGDFVFIAITICSVNLRFSWIQIPWIDEITGQASVPTLYIYTHTHTATKKKQSSTQSDQQLFSWHPSSSYL